MKTFLKTGLNTKSALLDEFQEKWGHAQSKRNRAIARSPNVYPDDHEAFRILDGYEHGLSAFVATNLPANKVLLEGLWANFRVLRKRQEGIQFAFVTILDPRYTTSDEETVLRIKPLKQASRRILTSMSENFVAGVELQSFSNRRWPTGGLTVSPHVHALIMGYDILERAAEKASAWNEAIAWGEDGCQPVDIKPLSDWSALARAIRYPLKAPSRMKNDYVNPRKGTRTINESEASDRYVRYLRQYQLHSMLQRDQLLFASGQGTQIKGAALRAAHGYLDANTVSARRAENMQWVSSFWSEFMTRMGLHRFKMPIIEI